MRGIDATLREMLKTFLLTELAMDLYATGKCTQAENYILMREKNVRTYAGEKYLFIFLGPKTCA